MPLPEIEDVYRCAFTWTNPASPSYAVNVLHVRCPLGVEEDVFDAIDDGVQLHQFETVINDWSVTDLTITRLDGGSASKQFEPTNWQGESDSATGAIINAPVIIKMQTGLRGPANRGRIYLPFTAEPAQLDGKLSAGVAAEVTTAWADWMAAMEADSPGVVLGVASYAHETFNPVTNILCENELGTMRRRQQRLRI